MRPSVLFVDDEPHVTAGLRRALRGEPWEILTAGSASEALEILARRRIDVVVSDEQMPGMSGVEFLARVCRRHPDTIRMILTGQASLEAAIKAINQGEVYRFFTKPCNDVDLAITIRQALHLQKISAERNQLLQLANRQFSLLRQMEAEHPGISRVKRTESGAIDLDAETVDFEQLMTRLGGGKGG